MSKEEPIDDVRGEELEDIIDPNDNLMDLGDSCDLFHCKRCRTSFDSEEKIDLHEGKCARSKPHVCVKCGAGFSRITTMNNHKKIHSNGYQPPLFSCTICAKTFRSQRTLKAHIPTHEFERVRDFACSECDKTYMNAKGLDQHVALTHKEKTHQCQICNKMFANHHKLKRHLSFHLDIRKFPCLDCDFKFKTSQALKRHSWVHNKEDPVTCELCGKRVADNGRLNEHINRKHNDQPKKVFPCDLCEVKLSSKTSLLEHKRRHLGLKPFQCPDCDKKFSDARSLRSHSATHSDKREFKCGHCSKDFKWLSNLKEHIDDMHTVHELKFSCPSCEMKFKSARHLKRHQRIHEKRERKFICQLCKKGFTSQNILNGHMKMHNDVRPFSCEMCSKTFRTKACLIDHMITHTGERAFACTQCDKRFGYSSALVKHMRLHTGERPYVCFICQEGFLEPKPLHVHMEKVHGATDNKPKKLFKCTLCYKKLCNKASLETHMRTHTDNSEFKCTICSKILACRSSMKVHMRNKHKAKVPEHKCTVCHKKYVNNKDLERHMDAMHNYHKNRNTEKSPEKHHMDDMNDLKGRIKRHVEDMNGHMGDIEDQRDTCSDDEHERDSQDIDSDVATKQNNNVDLPNKHGLKNGSVSAPRIEDDLFDENNPDMSISTLMAEKNVIKNLKRKCFVKLNRIVVPFDQLSGIKSGDSKLKEIANGNPRDQMLNGHARHDTDIDVMNFAIKTEPKNTIDVFENKVSNPKDSGDFVRDNSDEQRMIITDIFTDAQCKGTAEPRDTVNTTETMKAITADKPQDASETSNVEEDIAIEQQTSEDNHKPTENGPPRCECIIGQLSDPVIHSEQMKSPDNKTLIIPQTFIIKEEV
ncbi:unnamed protein product [Owenia fusiformis]|uniref:Uncharacterized protein n=1 Tax=Owenia fusiformis TaxID=6347 RepID=A0A8J1UBT1_OWEFU|nr:unnamed protein product [Owenia fusiformis]